MSEIIMSDIKAIKERHAVRNYKPDRIEKDKIACIIEKINEINSEGNLHFQFLENAGHTYNKLLNKVMGLSSAPSVIACVGKDNNSLDQRVGYYGEKLVLLAQKLGLNTCWAGTFNRKNINAEVNDGERLVISIAIGYGKNQGKQHKSKSAEDVTEVEGTRPEWFDNGVEMALLAPTAVNQQKFVIKLRSDETVEFINNAGMLGEVDLGIVRYHFEVGSGISQIPAE